MALNIGSIVLHVKYIADKSQESHKNAGRTLFNLTCMHTNRAAATLLLTLFFLFFSARCASIGHGRLEELAIESQPEGAVVSIVCAGSTVATGVTPVVLQMRRSATDCAANLTRDGFQDERVQLSRRLNRTYWLNALFAGVAVPAAGVANDGGIGSEGFSSLLYGVSAIGVAGLIYDHSSGRAYHHSPARITVRLTPQVSQPAARQ